MDADDDGDAIANDPNANSDVSVIIQEGFDDADVDAPPSANKERTDATYMALLQLRRLFRKEDLQDGEEPQRELNSLHSRFQRLGVRDDHTPSGGPSDTASPRAATEVNETLEDIIYEDVQLISPIPSPLPSLSAPASPPSPLPAASSSPPRSASPAQTMSVTQGAGSSGSNFTRMRLPAGMYNESACFDSTNESSTYKPGVLFL